MSDQPEALRLADELDAYHTRSCHKEAAACLRRQHEEIESAHQAQRDAENELSRALARHAVAEAELKAECDALRAELLSIGDLDKRHAIVRKFDLSEWADWAQNRARHAAREAGK